MPTIVVFLVSLSLYVTNGRVEHTMDRLITCEEGGLEFKARFNELERTKELDGAESDHTLGYYETFFNVYAYYIRKCDVYWHDEKGYFEKSLQDFRVTFESGQGNMTLGLIDQECTDEALCTLLSEHSVQINIDLQEIDMIGGGNLAPSSESGELLRSIYDTLVFIDYLQNDYTQMVTDAKRAWKLCYSIFGEQHVRTAKSYVILGLAYHKEGSYLKALDAHKQGLAIFNQLKEEEDIKLHIASVYGWLFIDYTKLKAWAHAREAARRKMHIYKEVFGPYDSRTIYAFLELCGSYCTWFTPEDRMLQYCVGSWVLLLEELP